MGNSALPDPLPVGFQMGRYVIGEELTAGWMGRMYQASDPGRKAEVTINVLAVGLRGQVDRMRFLRCVERAS